MKNTAREKAEILISEVGCRGALDFLECINMAIFCVDQIMKTTFSRYKIWDRWKIIPQVESTTEFWEEVKEELNKMK